MPDFNGLNHAEVGGAVRDDLLGHESEDIDFVVWGHSIDEMKSRGFVPIFSEGNFPVFTDKSGRDFALARTEQTTGAGHSEFEHFTSPEVTLEEDLKRRDLTINAIARLPSGELVDPFEGQEDLEAGILRHVSSAFSDDPLRVLRVARFAARFERFSVHPETMELMRDIASSKTLIDGKETPVLKALPEERIRDEMLKMFKQAESPRRFFEVLDDSMALDVVFGPLADLRGVPAGPGEHHGDVDSFEHTMNVIEKMQSIRPNDVDALLVALAHDLGKALTPEDVLPSHIEHESRAEEPINRLAADLKLFNHHIRLMKEGARLHMKIGLIEEMRTSTILKMTEELHSEGGLSLDLLIDLGTADSRAAAQEANQSPRFNPSEARRLGTAAQETIETISGHTIFDEHDVEQHDWERLTQIMHSRRNEHFRKLIRQS